MNRRTAPCLIALVTIAANLVLLMAPASAVGVRASQHPLTVHRFGQAHGWTIVAAPQQFATLNAIGVVSANDIWTAGYRYNQSRGGYDPASYHWNGSAWSDVKAPLANQGYNAFNGVNGTSNDDVWAVGYSTAVYYTWIFSPMVQHFDGSAWSVVPVHEDPSLYAGSLYSVTAVARDDAWAVGSTDDAHALIGHWDGGAWTLTNPLGTNLVQLFAVKALAKNNVWAAGSISRGGKVVPLIIHYDGSSWSIATTPHMHRKSNVLNGIAFSADNSAAFAVGVQSQPYKDPPVPYKALAEAWDGSSWRVADTDAIPWAFLYGVCVDHTGIAWAVGYQQGPQPLIERWERGAFRQQRVLPQGTSGIVTAIADDGSSLWAVGNATVQQGGALILRRTK